MIPPKQIWSTPPRAGILVITCIFILGIISLAYATQPPAPGRKWPSREFAQRLRSFQYNRSFRQLTRRIQENRAAVQRGELTLSAAAAAGGTTISGTKSIPVLLGTFNNTSSNPYPHGNLQTELFDGPWPTGTMTDYYREISYGRFTVTGTVYDWQKTGNNDSYYEGGTGCNGICTTAKLGDFLKETLDLNDTSIDFGQYDNDGPDGVPNSGDDDGYVDFVAFVHPENGGECGTTNIWSHRWIYSGWSGGDYTTNDAKNGGGQIRIDDYVIMPAVACDGTTMIQIGVFAHEFGHAFGLPDLYDTNGADGDSEGIGGWGLMAGGSWGGDNDSPESPSHMSAWSKEFLGWVAPTEVTSDLVPAQISNINDNDQAFKIGISADTHYLVSNRQKKGFDNSLTGSGLLIWRINETVVNQGLINNTVNADENNPGVKLIEADGRTDLNDNVNRGDAGDPFPGTNNNTKFDNTTNPASEGSVAVCNISDSADVMTAEFYVSSGVCDGVPTGTTGTIGTADVFATWGGGWYISESGTGGWRQINTSNATISDVLLADLTGDGTADVFTTWSGRWYISESGTGGWRQINTSSATTSDVLLADLTGDGAADVFATWGGGWYISESGTGGWRQINTSSATTSDVLLADLTGDGAADVFATWGGSWYISESGTSAWRQINTSSATTSDVLLADLTGDGSLLVQQDFRGAITSARDIERDSKIDFEPAVEKDFPGNAGSVKFQQDSATSRSEFDMMMSFEQLRQQIDAIKTTIGLERDQDKFETLMNKELQ